MQRCPMAKRVRLLVNQGPHIIVNARGGRRLIPDRYAFSRTLAYLVGSGEVFLERLRLPVGLTTGTTCIELNVSAESLGRPLVSPACRLLEDDHCQLVDGVFRELVVAQGSAGRPAHPREGALALRPDDRGAVAEGLQHLARSRGAPPRQVPLSRTCGWRSRRKMRACDQ